MTITGTGPLRGEVLRSTYEGFILILLNGIRNLSIELDKVKSIDNPFMAHIIALRTIVQVQRSTFLGKDEIAEWEEAYFAMLSRLKSKLPKKYDFEEFKANAEKEFKRLRKFAYSFTHGLESSQARDLACGNVLDQIDWSPKKEVVVRKKAPSRGRRIARKISVKQRVAEAPSQEMRPCNLITYPPELGEPKYGLTLEATDPAKVFAKNEIDPTGYAWHAVVDVFLQSQAKKIRRAIDFDCESSMFCVRSSDLVALRVVADFIKSAIDNPKLIVALVPKIDQDLL